MNPLGLAIPPRCLADMGHSRPKWQSLLCPLYPRLATELRTLLEVRFGRVGPGNFTPSLSQIPDLTLSRHPARATARRLPPSIDPRVPPVAG